MDLARALMSRFPLREAREAAEALGGTRSARRLHRAALDSPADFRSHLPWIARFGDLKRESAEDPVFILSAGWRSGSTMLQRMLMARGGVLVWGEPYDHCGILAAMKDQWCAFTARWPAENFFHAGGTEGMAEEWVANLYPPLQDLYDAHLAFLTRLFAEPARAAGAARWGVKEVRWSVDDAIFLQWMFPRARFLFLCRDPLKAWRSYRTARGWFLRWPDRPVLTPYAFGRLWSRLVTDFARGHDDVDGVFLRYEDILEREDFADLEEYLGLPVTGPGEIRRIRSRRPKTDLAEVPRLERWLLARGCGESAARMGY